MRPRPGSGSNRSRVRRIPSPPPPSLSLSRLPHRHARGGASSALRHAWKSFTPRSYLAPSLAHHTPADSRASRAQTVTRSQKKRETDAADRRRREEEGGIVNHEIERKRMWGTLAEMKTREEDWITHASSIESSVPYAYTYARGKLKREWNPEVGERKKKSIKDTHVPRTLRCNSK